MDFVQIKTGADDAGRRIDRVLRKLLPDVSLGEIYKCLRKGTIKVNAKKVPQNYHIAENDTLFLASFLLPEALQKAAPKPDDAPESKAFEIDTIFENEHIRIVNKPCGIPVHKANPKEISLAEIVAAEYRESHKNGSLSFTAGPLHRLDKNTSGIIVFSQSLKGAQWFSENLSLFQKEYLGIVQGKIESPQYWVDLIDDEPKESGSAYKTVRITTDEKAGKEARTKCFPLEYGSYKGTPITLCRFCIETGRKHQIRAQSAFHGFPLLGDSAYNKLTKAAQPERFYLHAFRLIVPANPINMPEITEAPLPEDFRLFLTETCKAVN